MSSPDIAPPSIQPRATTAGDAKASGSRNLPGSCWPSAGVFKGVCWGRGAKEMPDGRTGHLVAVVGVIICERPTKLAVADETILAGACTDLVGQLELIAEGQVPYKFGDAGHVLTALDDITPKDPS